jgi:hypothetical protein
MASDEIFESAVRSVGDLAGVFEYDGETAYFYLYETARIEGEKVGDSIHVASSAADLAPDDVSVRWNTSETKVGLFIRGVLWAMFDLRDRSKHGGVYRPGASPTIPFALSDFSIE